jgi:hypothetical protein
MKAGTVKIRGREYKTVALRVSEFREQCPASDGWAILTDIVERDAETVVMRASIVKDGIVLATGYAEENRKSSQINQTSCLENCETSCIGRALAAFGLGGSEYASANEVANAIHQQASPLPTPNPRQTPPETYQWSAADNALLERVKSKLPAANADDIRKMNEYVAKQPAPVQAIVNPMIIQRQLELRGEIDATRDS